MKKLLSSAEPAFARANPVENDDPTVWPDVSPTPSFVDQSRRLEIRFEKQTVLKALVTSPASIRRQFFQASLLLLVGLLRSLLHCVLRLCLLCLLSFLGHVALLM
jgi:hypothetical protein